MKPHRGSTLRPPPETVGYRRPPASSRFKPGHSGNPKGRPRGATRKPPYEAVLGQIVEIRLDGQARRVTAAEALLLKLVQTGVAGDARIGELVLTALEAEREAREAVEAESAMVLVRWMVSPDDPLAAMRHLGMVLKVDPYRSTARMLIEPWLVEAALTRLGDRVLTPPEQQSIRHATRTPNKVNWPQWWVAK